MCKCLVHVQMLSQNFNNFSEIYGGGPELFIKQNRGNPGGQSPPVTHKSSSSSTLGKSGGYRGSSQGDIEREADQPPRQEVREEESMQVNDSTKGQEEAAPSLEQDSEGGEQNTEVEHNTEVEQNTEVKQNTETEREQIQDREITQDSQSADTHTSTQHQKID